MAVLLEIPPSPSSSNLLEDSKVPLGRSGQSQLFGDGDMGFTLEEVKESGG